MPQVLSGRQTLPVEHWLFMVQLVGQPAVLHLYGVQSVVVPVHIPGPVHVSWAWSTVPTQVGPVPQSVPCATVSHMALAPQLLPLGQSLFDTHGTQAPLPSQNMVPMQEVSAGWLVTTHFLLVHTTFLHTPGLGQSLVCAQPQLPMPSQTWPVPQVTPEAALFIMTIPFVHELITHGLLGGGMSVSSGTVVCVPMTHFWVWQSFTMST
jgi:hypothetical protein